MAIAYASAGAGNGTETSGAQLQLACPATVNANDVLIAHVTILDITTTPSPPANWDLLYGPANLGTGTAVGRSWVYGKLAVGDEDGVTLNWGNPAVTSGRYGRIYSFSGYSSGVLADLVGGFSDTPTEGSIPLPTVTTSLAGALAVALLTQDDNNSFAAAGAVTGGTWAEPVAEFVSTTIGAQGCITGIQTCTPTANPGTVSGGTANATADEGSTIGFEIRAEPPPVPRFGAAGTQLQETASTMNVAVPAGVVAGSVVIVTAFVDTSSVTVTGMPSGFANAPDSPQGPDDNHRLYVMWKRATGADSGTYNFTMSGSGYHNAQAIRYDGVVDTGDPWNVTNAATDSASSTTTPAVSDTSTVDDVLWVWAATNWSGGTWTPPTNYTERRDSGDGVCTVADRNQAAAGASGSITGTCTGSDKRIAWLGALMSVAATSGATVDPATLALSGVDTALTGSGAGAISVDPAVLALAGIDSPLDGTATASLPPRFLETFNKADGDLGPVLGPWTRRVFTNAHPFHVVGQACRIDVSTPDAGTYEDIWEPTLPITDPDIIVRADITGATHTGTAGDYVADGGAVLRFEDLGGSSYNGYAIGVGIDNVFFGTAALWHLGLFRIDAGANILLALTIGVASGITLPGQLIMAIDGDLITAIFTHAGAGAPLQIQARDATYTTGKTVLGGSVQTTGTDTASFDMDNWSVEANTIAGLTLTGVDATLSAPTLIAVDPAALTLTGIDAPLSSGAGAITLDPATLALTGVDPTAAGTGTSTTTADPAALALTGQTPPLAGSGAAATAADPATLTLAGQTPALTGTGTATRPADPALLALTGIDATFGAALIIALDPATLTLTAPTPTLATGPPVATVDPATLALTGLTPALTATGNAPIPTDPAALQLTGTDPSLTGTGTATATIESATLTLTGIDPTWLPAGFTQPAVLTLTATQTANTLNPIDDTRTLTATPGELTLAAITQD